MYTCIYTRVCVCVCVCKHRYIDSVNAVRLPTEI